MSKKIITALGYFFSPLSRFVNKICIRLMHPEISRYIRYVKDNYAKNGKHKIRTAYGRGWKSAVVILDNKCVFKFPFASKDKDVVSRVAQREKRLVDSFRKVSPVYIPAIELINWNGLTVRKYEYVSGKQITDFNPNKVSEENCKKIAKQLANFIWVLQQYNPAELEDLKPNPLETSGFSTGWVHTDLATNFLMDDDFNVVAVIDWEDTYWIDVRYGFKKLNKSLDRRGYYGIFMNTIFDYMTEFIPDVNQY